MRNKFICKLITIVLFSIEFVDTTPQFLPRGGSNYKVWPLSVVSVNREYCAGNHSNNN